MTRATSSARRRSTTRVGSSTTATCVSRWAQSYANAKKVLAQYGATLDNVVEEVLYVTDMDAAFAVAAEVRTEAYGERPVVASTILVTPRLAFPSQLIEIKLIART